MNKKSHSGVAAGLLLLLLFLPTLATAEAYKFEMIIFERPGAVGGEYWPSNPGQPDRSKAVGTLGSQPAKRNLGPIAYTLKQKGMNVLKHMAWIQTPGSRSSNSWRWLSAGRLEGLVRLTRGRFLHLDTDLLLRDPNSSQPYRVQLNRRMRSNELHYLDHPKLGIIFRATRLRPATSAPDAGAGEPKPAQPG